MALTSGRAFPETRREGRGRADASTAEDQPGPVLGGGAGSCPEGAGPPDTLSSAPGEPTPAAEAGLPVGARTVAKQARPPRDLVTAHVPAPQTRGHTEPSPTVHGDPRLHGTWH